MTLSMPRELKVWNGRGWCCHNPKDPRWKDVRPDTVSAFICAFSRADARRVIAEYTGILPGDAELRDYFSEVWGNPMKGVRHERGLWLQFGRHTAPVRVLGGDTPSPAHGGQAETPRAAAAATRKAQTAQKTQEARPAAKPVPPGALALDANAYGVPQYPKGDARRLLVLLAAIDALPRATITTLATRTGLNKGTIAIDIGKLRSQYGVEIDFRDHAYEIRDWGSLLRRSGVNQLLKG